MTERAYLWAAREVRTGEVLAVQVSRGKGIGKCVGFLERLSLSCENRPTVYTDRGPWYGWPMRFLGMRRRRKTFGRRNSIESWFSALKRRAKQFNSCFPTEDPSIAERWIKSWVALS